MTYKTILVHADAEKRSAARIEIALGLARRYGAHVVGLYVHPRIILPPYVAAEHLILELEQRAAAEAAAQARSIFQSAVAAGGAVNAEWRTVTAGVAETLLLHARYADLLVVGQHDRSRGAEGSTDFVKQVLLAAGRPVVVIPHAGDFPSVGERILVAWNASREAARAVTDAIPLLRDAARVQIFAVNPQAGAHGDIPGADIALYLARHGVRVEATADEAVVIDVGNELLSRAADSGADLIVMGAYGHSRLQELVMGGTTRTIMESMTVPVLLSH